MRLPHVNPSCLPLFGGKAASRAPLQHRDLPLACASDTAEVAVPSGTPGGTSTVTSAPRTWPSSNANIVGLIEVVAEYHQDESALGPEGKKPRGVAHQAKPIRRISSESRHKSWPQLDLGIGPRQAGGPHVRLRLIAAPGHEHSKRASA